MVSEITELSRIETGKDTLNYQPTDINRLVAGVISQLTPLADRSRVALHSIPGALPLVPADRDRIRQVMVNLVHNAIKFNHPEGSVSVATSIADGSAVVTVVDTGIGISADDLPHVFERFFKADKAPRPRRQRTGPRHRQAHHPGSWGQNRSPEPGGEWFHFPFQSSPASAFFAPIDFLTFL